MENQTSYDQPRRHALLAPNPTARSANACKPTRRVLAGEIRARVMAEKRRAARRQFLRKHKDIARQLKAGQSIRNTAKIVGKGISTIQRVKAALAASGATFRTIN